jgi:hypothetical protein
MQIMVYHLEAGVSKNLLQNKDIAPVEEVVCSENMASWWPWSRRRNLGHEVRFEGRNQDCQQKSIASSKKRSRRYTLDDYSGSGLLQRYVDKERNWRCKMFSFSQTTLFILRTRAFDLYLWKCELPRSYNKERVQVAAVDID